MLLRDGEGARRWNEEEGKKTRGWSWMSQDCCFLFVFFFVFFRNSTRIIGVSLLMLTFQMLFFSRPILISTSFTPNYHHHHHSARVQPEPAECGGQLGVGDRGEQHRKTSRRLRAPQRDAGGETGD
jgi:hypothetical protein